MGFFDKLKQATKEGIADGHARAKADIAKKEKEQAEFLKRLQEAPDYKLEITIKGLESKPIDEDLEHNYKKDKTNYSIT